MMDDSEDMTNSNNESLVCFHTMVPVNSHCRSDFLEQARRVHEYMRSILSTRSYEQFTCHVLDQRYLIHQREVVRDRANFWSETNVVHVGAGVSS